MRYGCEAKEGELDSGSSIEDDGGDGDIEVDDVEDGSGINGLPSIRLRL